MSNHASKLHHWTAQAERGHRKLISLIAWLVKYLPLWVAKCSTFWVVSYFFLTAKEARQNIQDYHRTLLRCYPETRLPRFALFRHFLAFGESLTDRFAVWQGKIRFQDLLIDDEDNLYADIKHSRPRGQLLVCSHLGNMEVARAFASPQNFPHFKMSVLVHNRQSAMFNAVLAKAGANELNLIQVEDLNLDKMLELRQRIEQGEWLAIAADRVPIHGDKTERVEFLGRTAEFPQGAWLLANLLKIPVNVVFCLKEQGRYRFKLRRFADLIEGQGKGRQIYIRQAIASYAELLARECVKNPLLWFNFYNFWSSPQSFQGEK